MTFPIHDGVAPAFVAPLPAHADLVVIGGGIIGICTALYAARAGLRVVVCEKGRVAGEQSSRNWGWVRQQGRDLGELPIMMEAMGLWDRLAQEVAGLGFRRAGATNVARDAAALARYATWLEAARPFGVESRMVTAAEVKAMLPGLAGPVVGGLHTASDARAEPWVAVPLIARLAAGEGVVIRENCAVRSLDVAGGRVVGVVTEHGRVGADQVLLAGGAWSELLLARHGVALPQLSVRASVAETGPMPLVLNGAMSAKAGWAIRAREDGGYTFAPSGGETMFVGPAAFRHARWYLPALRRAPMDQTYRPVAPAGFPDAGTTPRRWSADRPSPFEAQRVLNPAPDRRAIARAARGFAAAFPGLGPIPIRSMWAGMIDTLPDVVPVVDRVARLPGLWVATGMSGHGFGIGPGFGRVLADLITGKPAGHDLSRFALARFDGPVRVDFGAAL